MKLKNLPFLCLALTLLACGKGKSVQSSNSNDPVSSGDLKAPPQVSCPDFTGKWVCSDSSGNPRWDETIVTTGNRYEITFGKSKPEEKKTVYVADGRINKVWDPGIGSVIADELIKKAMKLLPKNKLADFAMELKTQIDKSFKVESVLSCGQDDLQRKYLFEGELSHPLVTIKGVGQAPSMEKMVGANTRQLQINVLGKFSYIPNRFISVLTGALKDDALTYSDTFTCVRK